MTESSSSREMQEAAVESTPVRYTLRWTFRTEQSMSRRIARRRVLQEIATSTVVLVGLRSTRGDVRTLGRLDRIDEYVESAMAKWEVPGLALAIVKNGELLLARGYGVREFGTATAVDAETLFPIASCTKAFTAAAIAKLVDLGKLQWDDPIAQHLPTFQLADPKLTAAVTIRHDMDCSVLNVQQRV